MKVKSFKEAVLMELFNDEFKVVSSAMEHERKHSIFVKNITSSSHRLYCTCGRVHEVVCGTAYITDYFTCDCGASHEMEHVPAVNLTTPFPLHLINDIRIFHDKKGESGSTINKVSIKILLNSMYFNKKADQLTSQNTVLKLIYNIDTHALYSRVNRKLTRVSLGLPLRFDQAVLHTHDQKEIHRMFNLFFEEVFRVADLSHILPEPTGQYAHCKAELSVLRFPVLGFVPTLTVPKEERTIDFLKKKPTYKETLRYLYGTTSKSVSNALRGKEYNADAVTFARLLEDENLMLEFYKQHEIFSERHRSHRLIAPIDQPKEWTRNRGFISTHVRTVEIESMFYDLMSIHQDKKHLLRRVVKFMENPQFVFTNLFSYLSDTARLIRSVRGHAHYVIRYDGDLVKLHDRLSKDITRLQYDNRSITYSEDLKGMEGVYGDYTFALEKDTHSIIRLGGELDICIGGYADDAAKGNLFIFTATPLREGLRKIVLDLYPHEGRERYTVSQVKCSNNNRPNYEEASSVVAFFKANKIHHHLDHGDLRYFANPFLGYGDFSTTRYANQRVLDIINEAEEPEADHADEGRPILI